jgi:GrpB-like predicted nucleotidyltransferase (UPF0157 family)
MGDVTGGPAWATEGVEVRPADPAWQRPGEGLRRKLDMTLARWLVAPVEHVGSTAVPGPAAKPILDLQAAVVDLDCASASPRHSEMHGISCLPSSMESHGADS